MDINSTIGTLQLAVALLQLHLDHFKRSRSLLADEKHAFSRLGDAIRTLEYALTETVFHVENTGSNRSNERISRLWRDASESLREIEGSDELVDITYQKGLFWRNPNFFKRLEKNEMQRISLENVLRQITPLRKKYENLLKAVRGG